MTADDVKEMAVPAIAINGKPITATDPMVEQCGYCGRRIEVCKADRRDVTRCDDAPSGWRGRPGML